MFKVLTAATLTCLMAMSASIAHADTKEAKDWCNDAHMKTMDGEVSKMTDKAKQKEAEMHLSMSKDAMKSKDMDGCVKHMKEAHKSMGM